MEQLDRHCGGIKRARTLCRSSENTAVRSMIDIVETSNEITYALQEGGECSSQADIAKASIEITYFLQEGRMQQ